MAKLKKTQKNTKKHKGFCKYVDCFQDNESFYLVSEHGGVELFGNIEKYHPFNNNKSDISNWKLYIQYHFAMIVKCVYYLHKYCSVAHCDLSLENCVIDKYTTRIIDFGVAQCDVNNLKNNWKSNKLVGKSLYQSPEIRKLRSYLVKQYVNANINANVNININCNRNDDDKKINHENQDTSDNDNDGNTDCNNNNNNNNNNKNHRKDEDNNCDSYEDYYYNPFECDVWALGVMLFIMLVGAQPWMVAERSQESFNAIMDGKLDQLLQAWESAQYVDKQAQG